MATATNHLADKFGYTKTLLEDLAPDELAEQVAYWREQRDIARANGDARSATGYGKELSIAAQVMGARAHD
jgi:hypothetical protein